MLIYSTQETRQRLCELLRLTRAGVPFVVSTSGEPVAKVVPLSAEEREEFLRQLSATSV